jgi:hypothetical protein
MYWLHHLMDHGEEVIGQALKVHRIPQFGAAGCARPDRVVPAAVAAPVDECLDAPAQRLEECCNHQGGRDNR